MMTNTLALVLSLVLPAVALAQKPAGGPPPPPKPAAALEQMKYFIGTWKCAGKQFDTKEMGPEHPVTGKASSKLEVDGFWQSFTYEEAKTAQHAGLKVLGLWGYDLSGQRFVRAAVSNQGAWDSGTSSGWVDNKMLWTGNLSTPGGGMAFRHTFTKKSPREWSHMLELNLGGAWVNVVELTCKK